jgi:hypothetical protein
MAIDPNIAMGIRPIEQPNMLAQMGQMMQLRQLKQEYEGTNALRDFYAEGGDINKAEDRQRLLSRAPVQGQKILGQESERRARDVGTIEKRQAFFINQIKSATTPEHIAQITQAMYGDPDVGPMLKGIRPLSDSLAAIPTDPKGIEEFRRRMTLGADNLFESANAQLQAKTSRYSTDVAAGTAATRLQFDRDKDTREQEQLKAVLGIVSPGTVSSATALPINMGGGGGSGGVPVTPPAGSVQTPPASVVPVTPPVGAAPVTPATSAAGQPNVLATQVAPSTTPVPVPTTVNNLGQGSQKEQLVDQISQLSRIPTTAASRALDMKVKEFNVLYPTEKIEQDREGNLITVVNGVAKPVVGLTGLPVQGKRLPETAFESAVGSETGKETVAFVKRVEAAPKNIAKIDEALGILKSGGAVTGFGAESRLNLERAMSLFGNDVKSGKRVVDTQILDALLGSDVFPSLQAMGLGSKNIDTPAEREFIRQVITGTIQLDNDALIRLTQIRRKVETDAIKEYNQKLESGKFDKYSKAAGQKLEKIEVPNPIIRQGRHKNGRLVIERADGTLEYGN